MTKRLVVRTALALALTAAVAGVVAAALGVTPLVVRSGSMEPSISTGSLALVREAPASDLAVGDVVSVRDADGERLTHRVADLTPSDTGALLTLRGDANPTSDALVHDVAAADRMVLDVPLAGYAVSALASRWGLFTGGLLLVGLAGAALRSGRGRRLAVAALSVSVVPALLVVTQQPTTAAFNDTAEIVSGDFQTRPANFSCEVIRTNGTVVPGYTCAPVSARCQPYSDWIYNYANVYIKFTSNASTMPYDGSLRMRYKIDLSDLGCAPSGWTWNTAGLLDAGDQVEPVNGYQCSSLPVVEATSPRWAMDGGEVFTRMVRNRGGYVWWLGSGDRLDCA